MHYVHDAATDEAIGAIRRKGLKSIVRDEWILLSNEGQEIGKLTESSMAGVFLSRFINSVPQRYVIVSADGREVVEIKQHLNPFVFKYSMTIVESEPSIDPRLLVSSGILLAGIERRQR